MPWTCSVCDVEVADDAQTTCPHCEQLKTSWTILGERTRAFSVTRKKRLRVLRGESATPAEPADPAYSPATWRAAKAARVLPKEVVAPYPSRGVWPAPRDLVWVVLSPAQGQQPDALVSTLFAQQVPADLAVPAEAGVFDDRGQWAAPVVFVAGDGPPPEVPGVVVVDVTEDAPTGFAPAVEVSGLGRGPKELPTEPAAAAGQHGLPGALFAYDSAFPRPGVVAHVGAIAQRLALAPDLRLAVFGHTDAVGSDAYNKTLSDQRAQGLHALLVGDLPALDASSDGWTLADYQAVLRAVGCDPGAIDGKEGPMTRAATRAFQGEYNAGLHHPGSAPAHPNLEVDGLPGPKTRAALRDAYLTWASPRIDGSRLGGPKVAGCSELNPLGDDPAANRRVTLAFFPEGEAGEPPCAAGDVSACAVDDGGRFRCSYYRELIGETEQEAPPAQPFFDYGWLRSAEGQVHLSALTTLADETPCRITVHRAPPVGLPSDSVQAAAAPDLGPAVATLEAEVRGGVAQGTWETQGEDPFDLQHFVSDVVDDDEDPDGPLEDAEEEPGEEARPFVFRIDAEGSWGISGPPSVRLDRLLFVGDVIAQGIGVRPDGSLIDFQVEGGRVARRDEVVALELREHVVSVVTEEAS